MDEREGESVCYVIRCEITGLRKIGHSREPAKRLRDLQVGCPTRLTLEAFITGDGAAVEASMHKAYALRRSHGEWFALRDSDIDALSSHAGFSWVSVPSSAKRADPSEDYDSLVSLWIRERCDVARGLCATFSDMRDSFYEYAGDEGVAVPELRFREALDRRGHVSRKSGSTRLRVGIALKRESLTEKRSDKIAIWAEREQCERFTTRDAQTVLRGEKPPPTRADTDAVLARLETRGRIKRIDERARRDQQWWAVVPATEGIYAEPASGGEAMTRRGE